MKTLLVACVVATLSAGPARAGGPDAVDALLEGNRRFANAHATHPHQTAARRTEVAAAQKPDAVIVGCADSRVPPELVFDQGLGDVFVVRSAGHVVDDTALGSIEFAVAKLGARRIVVLGHERCGAVDAALKGGPVPGHIGTVVDAIRPNITQATAEPGDPLDNAVRDHVRATVARLKTASPILAPMVADGSLRIVGAVYDLDSGSTKLVSSEPEKQP